MRGAARRRSNPVPLYPTGYEKLKKRVKRNLGSRFFCTCHSLTFIKCIFVYMDTNEILKKLESLLGLEQKFRAGKTLCLSKDVFEFHKANGWPVVTELQTSLGVLTISDEIGNKIPFFVSYSYWFLNRENEENNRFKKVLDNVTAMLTISIDVNNLKERKKYKVHISGEKLIHEDGDQYAECYTNVKDNMILALQRPVPNDFDYWDMDSLVNIFENEHWKNAWRYITIEDDYGFYFILKDKTIPVEFDIAWMNMKDIGEYDCSDALSFYLT